ncbi:MAG: FKBP-type peptidyl-prolyl cis-trans isomerase [Telluria sp.]
MKMKLPLIAAFVALVSLTACGGGGGDPQTAPTGLVYSGAPGSLVIKDTTVGTGAKATSTSTVSVKYTGWLYNDKAADFHGTQFDTGTLSAVTLGQNHLIPGFEQGIAGMQVGGKRTVYIPPSLGYGSVGSGTTIPPNAGLVFDIELLTSQ